VNWNVEEAQQRFRELISAATQEPQIVYNQDEVVAVIIEAKVFNQFLDWRQQQTQTSLAEKFATFRQLCVEEKYTLEVPTRDDRPNPFSHL
jgi:hypothetical protein